MQSNGGVVPVSQLGSRAAFIVRSGPAAGVMAAAELAAEAGYDRIITGDMGGTSFDVAVVIEGKPAIAENTLLDFRIPLRLPMIDVHTIGAGGGSIAHIDRAGILQVGPESAGAYPGPVCWGRGGTQPTVTDANVVLARIDPSRPIGIERESLDIESARAAMGALGAKLGLGVEETAEAILAVVNQRMAGPHPPAVDRARPRSARLRAGGVRRRRAGAWRGADAGGRHRRDAGAALSGRAVRHGLRVGQRALRLFAHGRARHHASSIRGDVAQIMREQRAEGEAQVRASEAPVEVLSATHASTWPISGRSMRCACRSRPDWTFERMTAAFNDAYKAEFGNTLAGIPVMVINVRTTVEGKRKRAERHVNGAGADAGRRRAHAQAPRPLRRMDATRRSSAAAISSPA